MSSGFPLEAPLPSSAAEPLEPQVHPKKTPCSIEESFVGNECLQCCISTQGCAVLFLG